MLYNTVSYIHTYIHTYVGANWYQNYRYQQLNVSIGTCMLSSVYYGVVYESIPSFFTVVTLVSITYCAYITVIIITWFKQRLDWHLRHIHGCFPPPHYFPESRKTSPVIVVSTTPTLFSIASHTLILIWSFILSTLIPQYKVILHNPRALQESCERTFQLSLHAIIIQPHCEPHPQSTYRFGLVTWTHGGDWYWQFV